MSYMYSFEWTPTKTLKLVAFLVDHVVLAKYHKMFL